MVKMTKDPDMILPPPDASSGPSVSSVPSFHGKSFFNGSVAASITLLASATKDHQIIHIFVCMDIYFLGVSLDIFHSLSIYAAFGGSAYVS